jgi:hypothetical protein
MKDLHTIRGFSAIKEEYIEFSFSLNEKNNIKIEPAWNYTHLKGFDFKNGVLIKTALGKQHVRNVMLIKSSAYNYSIVFIKNWGLDNVIFFDFQVDDLAYFEGSTVHTDVPGKEINIHLNFHLRWTKNGFVPEVNPVYLEYFDHVEYNVPSYRLNGEDFFYVQIPAQYAHPRDKMIKGNWNKPAKGTDDIIVTHKDGTETILSSVIVKVEDYKGLTQYCVEFAYWNGEGNIPYLNYFKTGDKVTFDTDATYLASMNEVYQIMFEGTLYYIEEFCETNAWMCEDEANEALSIIDEINSVERISEQTNYIIDYIKGLYDALNDRQKALVAEVPSLIEDLENRYNTYMNPPKQEKGCGGSIITSIVILPIISTALIPVILYRKK